MRQITLTDEDLVAIGKAASFLRFQAIFKTHATDEARKEWRSMADSLTDIECRCLKAEDLVCDECGGSGEIDSGGFTPWMAPINVPCGKCAHPAEDPDEWVIQDRVPVRPGIDQVCWNEKLFDAQAPFGFIETCCGSQSDGKMHGYGADGCYLSARCRRRDLPKENQ